MTYLLCGISSLFILFYAVYLWRAAFFFRPDASKRSDMSARPFFSVIIPARNEEEHIGACLSSVFAQDYPSDRYEVILVNDHSEDKTVERAMEAAKGHSNFRLINLEMQQGPAFKKAAVAAGIAASQGEIILTTDADCSSGPAWISAMAANFDEETGLVSGPVVLESGNLFEHFQALEFLGLIGVGAAAINAGSPNMCNGANLAYRKEVFEEVGGFSGIDHIASGDDELLMHKIAARTRHKIRFAHDPKAIVSTPALSNWQEFKAQRIRWVSKSTQYKKAGITLTLVLSWLAIATFPVLLVAGFFACEAWFFLLGNFILKMAGEFPILYRSATFFNKLQLLKYLPLEQIVHIPYVLWVGIAGNQKAYTWKGREVK